MLILILIAVLIVIGIGAFVTHQRRTRLTADAPATVISTTLRQLAPKDNGRFETDVIFRFKVNGEPHDVRYTAAGNRVDAYPPGTAGRVRYNPDKPAEADVIPPD